MKTLIVDCNIDLNCWGSSDISRLLTSCSTAITAHVRRGPQRDLPSLENFDRVIVSGSKTSALAQAPWIDDLLAFIRQVVDAKIPYLGICFGHQMLARAISGTRCLTRSVHPEFGWVNIGAKREHALFQNMPPFFHTFAAHFEEVAELPKNGILLASSPDCAIQSFQLESLPIFGIQFHPEKPLTEATSILKDRKKAGKPSHLLHPTQGNRLYSASVGETLFHNFLKFKQGNL